MSASLDWRFSILEPTWCFPSCCTSKFQSKHFCLFSPVHSLTRHCNLSYGWETSSLAHQILKCKDVVMCMKEGRAAVTPYTCLYRRDWCGSRHKTEQGYRVKPSCTDPPQDLWFSGGNAKCFNTAKLWDAYSPCSRFNRPLSLVQSQNL